jgi:sugar diacid utilization regulator
MLTDKNLDHLNTASILLDSILYGEDLWELSEKIADILKNPVLIMDAKNTLLAYSKRIPFEDESWQQHIELGQFSFEYAAAIRRFNASIVIPNDSTPYMQKNDISPARRIVSRLYADGIHIGYLVTLEANEHFNDINMKLYKLIADTCANIMKYNKEQYFEKGYKNYESIFIDLINGHFVNRSVFLKATSNSKLNISGNYILVCLDIRNYYSKKREDNFLLNSLIKMFNNSWTFYYSENVITLIKLKEDERLPCLSEFKNFLKRNKLKAGISCSFNDLYLLSEHYSQAKRALEISEILQGSEELSYYEDCKFYDMLSKLHKGVGGDGANLKKFCHSVIFRILEYDTEHKTEYLKTLWVYINNGKNSLKTSQKMHIHKNTVIYRIQKLQEYFSVDLSDDSLIFKLYYSYIIHSYLNDPKGLVENN